MNDDDVFFSVKFDNGYFLKGLFDFFLMCDGLRYDDDNIWIKIFNNKILIQETIGTLNKKTRCIYKCKIDTTYFISSLKSPIQIKINTKTFNNNCKNFKKKDNITLILKVNENNIPNEYLNMIITDYDNCNYKKEFKVIPILDIKELSENDIELEEGNGINFKDTCFVLNTKKIQSIKKSLCNNKHNIDDVSIKLNTNKYIQFTCDECSIIFTNDNTKEPDIHESVDVIINDYILNIICKLKNISEDVKFFEHIEVNDNIFNNIIRVSTILDKPKYCGSIDIIICNE